MVDNSQIDDVIRSVVGTRRTKVAMVIAKVAEALGRDLPAGKEGLEAISARIQHLASRGRLQAYGDLSNWRFSEVRLPDND